MQRYVFNTNEINWETKTTTLVRSIQYKCLICGYIHNWDDTWTDEKKSEIKLEIDKHHSDHIIPDEPTLSE